MATQSKSPQQNERNHFIDGRWVSGGGPIFDVINPAGIGEGWKGAAANSSEVRQACTAACEAFPLWASTPMAQRIAICQRFGALLKDSADSLARTISGEVGKPLWEARTEVASMAAKIPISISAYTLRTGESISELAEGNAVRRHRPHGALAVFGPYNFPGHLPNGHIVPALLAGNSIVFKPSESAPQTAIATVALWQAAGAPSGVINLLQGGVETGTLLANCVQSTTPHGHALAGILFTGSHRTGALLHRQLAGQPGKMLALEMGGNNALVIWDADNLDAAVHHAIVSAFISAGQRCTCARRVIVEDGPRGAAFIDRLVEVASRLVVVAENGTNSEVSDTAESIPFMGPVISGIAAENLLSVQEDLLKRGAVSLLPMRSLKHGTGLLSAGILDVTEGRNIPDEEWFGPLLQVIRVKDFAAALKVANSTRYGLAAGLISDRPELWQVFQTGIRAGIVNWNRPTTGAASSEPFGGIGDSGNHRPSALYAADYCAYPVASIESKTLQLPEQLLPGLDFS